MMIAFPVFQSNDDRVIPYYGRRVGEFYNICWQVWWVVSSKFPPKSFEKLNWNLKTNSTGAENPHLIQGHL